MGVEATTGYITSLNTSWPAGDETRREGDNHLRMIKSILKNTFPNLNGEVILTPAQSNRLVDAITESEGGTLSAVLASVLAPATGPAFTGKSQVAAVLTADTPPAATDAAIVGINAVSSGARQAGYFRTNSTGTGFGYGVYAYLEDDSSGESAGVYCNVQNDSGGGSSGVISWPRHLANATGVTYGYRAILSSFTSAGQIVGMSLFNNTADEVGGVSDAQNSIGLLLTGTGQNIPGYGWWGTGIKVSQAAVGMELNPIVGANGIYVKGTWRKPTGDGAGIVIDSDLDDGQPSNFGLAITGQYSGAAIRITGDEWIKLTGDGSIGMRYSNSNRRIEFKNFNSNRIFYINFTSQTTGWTVG